MTRTVLVTGGTGTLGRALVARLQDCGDLVRVLSRQPRPNRAGWVTGDLATGAGLDAAVEGVDVVVHCATTNGKRDVATTDRLIAAVRAAGAAHVVYVSIVGVDRIPLPYYKAKLAAEHVVSGSGVPFSIQRATQFHDLLVRMFGVQRFLPALLVPSGTSFQPIDVRDVASRLAEVVSGDPAGRRPDIGGPDIRRGDDLARAYLRAVARRRWVLPVRAPGAIASGYRAGHHLAPEHRDGSITFEQFLETSR